MAGCIYRRTECGRTASTCSCTYQHASLQAGSSVKAWKLDPLESGETGILHEIYHATMRPWFDFGVELGAPAVRKHSVTLTVR